MWPLVTSAASVAFNFLEQETDLCLELPVGASSARYPEII